MSVDQPMTPRPTFVSNDLAFRRALRERVDAYFKREGKSRYADARMVGKTIFLLVLSAAVMVMLISGVIPALAALPTAMGMGLLVAGLGFNIAHDAVHGAYSSSAMVNRILGALFDVLGASSYNWARAHNIVHHTYTNVPGIDHDLDPGPFLLFYPRANPNRIYRFQHVFAFPLYAFTLIMWVFKKDFVQIFDRSMTGKPASKSGAVLMLCGKVLHFAIFLGLPLWLSPYSWWQVLLAYGCMLATAGLALAVVFQLAHVVEGPQYPQSDKSNHFNTGWAAHQLQTTSNFAQDSVLATFLMGGLNNQIEHHLLPGICHIHYSALAPVVRECAKEYGLSYLTSGTFSEALRAHVRMLYRLGRPQLAH